MVWDEKELHMMTISSCYLPKKSESKPNGEDAHIYSPTRGIIIVCDGVGGNKGIDSGVYAVKLVLNTAAALEKQPQHDVNPKEALLGAHDNTSAKGSSTACVIALTRNKLPFANVGDSGFLVFLGWGRLVHASRKGQRFFNHPYQLAEWKSRSEVSRVVDEGEVEVEAGDVVVAGTDGLFDNMFVSEISDILRETPGRGISEKLARRIASRALSNSQNMNYESPFQKEALILAGKVRPGGKYDDITVVVAEIGVIAAVEECKTEEVEAEMESAVVAECKSVTMMGQVSWANIVNMNSIEQ